ncbi:MAG: GntR family transcriptional regulator [Pyrinomonadaceae bacterium]|nr:GntR family transcriptional regulator [Pyrinomonadaceae bacterium]
MAKPKTSFVSSRIPLYYQLENVLREKITSGSYADGEKLPTEIELIEEYGVSRITVRQALAALAEDGLIDRKQGRGTYIAERKSKQRKFSGTIHLTGSLDELIEMGRDTPVKVLEMNLVDADQHEAELLRLKIGTPIYRLKRLRLRENKPYSLIVNYLPEEIGAKLTMAELSSGALLHTMETKLGLVLHDARQEIRAELADPYIAKLLDVRVGTALLSIERTVYTVDQKPVEYVHTLYRSDLYGYSVYLKREIPL